MTVATVLASLAQIIVVVLVAPLLLGLMRQVRARMEGRAGAGIWQPWRDLRKLFRRQPISAVGTTWAFRIAPLLLLGTTLVVAATVPLLTTATMLDSAADLFVVVGMLALGTAVLALAALDTGTAFGGMGASREMTVLALAEPTILVAIFALSARVGSTNLGQLVDTMRHDPLQVVSPASLLAAAALLVVTVAETGRVPVDNPATHLELTMLHEAMVLEYSGTDLALIELAASMRLTLLLGLVASLFTPWGIATTLAGLPLALIALIGKVAVLGTTLAAIEVMLAKLRLFRVPELLAGSFVLALLAATTSYFLA